jgi:ectoine hydroxylase-related dioxygenase (phytanoyl-CoA dioxygenase family)
MLGSFSSQRLHALADAYDQVMAAAYAPDFKVGSTTTRTSDLLSFGAIFDEVFLYKPLVETCSHFFRQDFKLSSLLGRTLRPETPAQGLHTDLPRTSEDAPLLGFILMIDPFREENGATRFVPGSHQWPGVPAESMEDTRAPHPGETLSCGEAGTMVLFDGAIWHGHAANVTSRERRSIQGYFIRRNVRQGFDFRSRLPDHVQERMNPLARHLLALDEERHQPT